MSIVTAIGLFGPMVAPHDHTRQQRERLLTERGTPAEPLTVDGHPLGADPLGRDELSRLLHGGATSLLVAVSATGLATALGLLIGITSGYLGGVFDLIVMRLIDILLSMPFLLIAIAIRAVIEEPGLWTLASLLGGLSWTTLARVTRAKTQQIRELDFVHAARALGMSRARILVRHVLPNVLAPALILSTTLIANMIMAESAMSYLGLGVEEPEASWGTMLREGQEIMTFAPRLMIYPSVLLIITVFGFNLLGEGLRDALDPKDF